MKRAWKWGNEEAPESDSAFDRMPAHDVSINSHRLYTFLLLFTSLSFVTDYRIMQNISCNLSRIIHACFFLCSIPSLFPFISLSFSLSFSLPLSLSFHSILTKYRYIECKVQIRLEKSVFSSFFRFVKFEIFQIQNLSYLFFSFYILFQLSGCQEFYYLYFNIYILMINFIF